ncbi:MAG: hypothetical protein ACRDPF_08660 [Streptosporangiaceae bacterium]
MPEVIGLGSAGLSGDEVIATPYGTVVLEHTFPADESSAVLFDAMDAQRAAQAYLWSLPLVGFAVWREEQARVFKATGFGDYVVSQGAESNWLKTVDQDGWFVYFRLYAPTEPFFNRIWSLPDFEPI